MPSSLRKRITELKKAHRPAEASSTHKKMLPREFLSGFVRDMKDLITPKQIESAITYLENTGASLHRTPDSPPEELKRKIERQGAPALHATTLSSDGQHLVFCPITDLTILGTAILQHEAPPEVLERFVKYLAYLSVGLTHKKLMSLLSVTWRDLLSMYTRFEATQLAVREAREIGEDFKKIARLEAAHERAVDGIEESVFTPSGRLCGTRRVFSDKLLTLLLKGDDPDRFSTTQQKVDIKEKVTVVINTGFDRETLLSEGEAAQRTELESGEGHVDWERLPVASIIEGEEG